MAPEKKSPSRRKRITSIRCPICRQSVPVQAEEFPFCSRRCRTMDLARWSTGAYVISTPLSPEEKIHPGSESLDD